MWKLWTPVSAIQFLHQSGILGYRFGDTILPNRRPVFLDTVETLSPEEWIAQARSPSVKKKRQLLIRYWMEANKYQSPADVEPSQLYRSFNRAMEFLEARKMAPNTLAQWRGCYRDFIKACFGDFNETRFDAIVKTYQPYTVKEKLCPKPEEFRELLIKAGTRDKALISFLGCTGMRIMEALTRRWSDISRSKVRIDAGVTKKRYLRYAFLGRETLKLLAEYKAEIPGSEWIFPGETPTEHLGYWAAAHSIRDVFRLAGLRGKSKDQSYSPHSFRAFAQMIMRRAGFSDTWADLIVGYKNVKTKSYRGDWDEVEKSWMERVEPHMQFLNPDAQVSREEIDALSRELENLKATAKGSGIIHLKDTRTGEHVGSVIVPASKPGPEDRVVPLDQVENYLGEGWEFVSVLGNSKCVVRKR